MASFTEGGLMRVKCFVVYVTLFSICQISLAGECRNGGGREATARAKKPMSPFAGVRPKMLCGKRPFPAKDILLPSFGAIESSSQLAWKKKRSAFCCAWIGAMEKFSGSGLC